MPKNAFDQLDRADCFGHPEVASQNALTRTQAGQQGKVREVRLDTPILSYCIRDACLRIGDVAAIIGLSVPTIYREIANGRFPRPIKLTPGARAWKMSDVMDWIDTRERDGPEPSSTSKCTGPLGQHQPDENPNAGKRP